MTPRRINVRKVPADDYPGRWKKALERLGAMEDLLKSGSLDSAMVLAVHAAIAACDSFTTAHRGEVASSDRHLDAWHVFTRVARVQGSGEAQTHLERLLREKSRTEYSDRYPNRDEAEGLCGHARRFVRFVEKNLK